MGTKIVKLLSLIVGVAVTNIVVLSPGFIGLEIGDNAIATASAVTLLFASSLTLFYGCYAFLFKPSVVLPIKQIKTHEDYVASLGRYRRIKALEEDISVALAQLERMRKKQSTLFEVLDQRFEPSELSYRKFASVIREVQKLFYLNVRGALNRLQVLDGAELAAVASPKTARLPTELFQEKANMYNEQLAYVKSAVGTNEEILLKLDKLLLEITKLDSHELGDIENMPGMREIDSLIKHTKLYKQ
jgi:hypothetical protein